MENSGYDELTTSGNKTVDPIFTSNANSIVRNSIATRLAVNSFHAETGRCTRFAKSLRSSRMLSHLHTAITPVSTMDTTMNRYSSPSDALYGSIVGSFRIHCRNVEYLS